MILNWRGQVRAHIKLLASGYGNLTSNHEKTACALFAAQTAFRRCFLESLFAVG